MEILDHIFDLYDLKTSAIILGFIVGILIFVLTFAVTTSFYSAFLWAIVGGILPKIVEESVMRSNWLIDKFYPDPIKKKVKLKDSFRRDSVPDGFSTWPDFAVNELQVAGFTPISIRTPWNEDITIPVYEVYYFGEETNDRPDVFEPEKSDWKEKLEFHYLERLDRDGTLDQTDHFSLKAVERSLKARGRPLFENWAIYVTGIRVDDSQLKIRYVAIRYYELYVLVNSLEFMTGKFPRTELYSPAMLMLSPANLADLKRLKFDILREIPPILGVEIIVITKEKDGTGKFLLQRRSGKVAAFPDELGAAVSAGYELDSGQFKGWRHGALVETKYELGIKENEVTLLELIALIHSVPTGELNFIAYMETTCTFEEIQARIALARRNKGDYGIREEWEHKQLVAYDPKSVANDDWLRDFGKKFDYDKGRPLDRIIDSGALPFQKMVKGAKIRLEFFTLMIV